MRRAPSQGSISIEAILVIPVFIVFLALILAIGRTTAVRCDLHAGVVSGARIASLETSSSSAQLVGVKAIEDYLVQKNITCLSSHVVVDTSAFDLPPGQPGMITARITCIVGLSDLGVPGLPGHFEITESFGTPIDTYSGR
jgi:hypothetical protein